MDDVGVGHGVGVVAAEDVDVLADTEHLWRFTELEHNAGAEAGGGVTWVCTEDADGAAGGRAKAHHELDGGRFASAVGTEEGDDFAAAESEGEIVECEDTIGVTLGDVVE